MPAPLGITDYRITSPFGAHHGLDFGVPTGSPVLSPVDGIVETTRVITTRQDRNGSYGVYVVVRDAQGNRHYLAHLSSYAVRPGQRVALGSYLGASGNSGNSTGPHLHWEIRDAQGRQVDPTPMLTDGRFTGFQMPGSPLLGTDPDEMLRQLLPPRMATQELGRLPDLDPIGLADAVRGELGIEVGRDQMIGSLLEQRRYEDRLFRDAESWLDEDTEEMEGELVGV